MCSWYSLLGSGLLRKGMHTRSEIGKNRFKEFLNKPVSQGNGKKDMEMIQDGAGEETEAR